MSLEEYGRMLYTQPRGVSCATCHGTCGEGKVIARYHEINKLGKKREQIIKGSDIRGIESGVLHKALLKGPSVMPKYYLTQKEEEAIVYFLKQCAAEGDEGAH